MWLLHYYNLCIQYPMYTFHTIQYTAVCTFNCWFPTSIVRLEWYFFVWDFAVYSFFLSYFCLFLSLCPFDPPDHHSNKKLPPETGRLVKIFSIIMMWENSSFIAFYCLSVCCVCGGLATLVTQWCHKLTLHGYVSSHCMILMTVMDNCMNVLE